MKEYRYGSFVFVSCWFVMIIYTAFAGAFDSIGDNAFAFMVVYLAFTAAAGWVVWLFVNPLIRFAHKAGWFESRPNKRVI